MVVNPELGKLQAEYKSMRWRVRFHTLVAGVLLALGLPLVLDYVLMGRKYTVFFVPGVALVLGSLMIAFMTYAHQFGRTLEVYEQGVRLGLHGRSYTWTYGDLKAFRIVAQHDSRYGYEDYHIKAYRFYTENRYAFSVSPIYPDWEHLGMMLTSKVRIAVIPQYIARIKSGQDVTFDRLKSAYTFRRLNLKVSAAGLSVKGKTMLPWQQVRACEVDPNDSGRVVVTDIKGKIYTAFLFYNSTNSVMAMRVINAMRSAGTV